jgi:hypothetical protein
LAKPGSAAKPKEPVASTLIAHPLSLSMGCSPTVIDNKHSTEIGARVINLLMGECSSTARRLGSSRFNVDRVRVADTSLPCSDSPICHPLGPRFWGPGGARKTHREIGTRVTRCDRDIDMGYRYGTSIWDIDMGHRTSMGYRYGYRYGIWVIDMEYGLLDGHPPYRYGHPGYRYGIWANDMGDDGIDMVILEIDMGYHVTLLGTPASGVPWGFRIERAASRYAMQLNTPRTRLALSPPRSSA